MGSSKKSRQSSESNPGFVRVEDCRERHENTKAEITLMKNALFGSDGRGGIVKDIGDIKTKITILVENRWSPKEKATIVAAFLAAATAIVVALLK